MASSSSSWYPPDASFLFYIPPKPNFPRPPSPPRRSATSAQDARHASYLSELQSLAESKSLLHHGVGDHLPARGDGSGQKWKEEGRRREVLRGRGWWSGSGVNEEEERWLNAEEAAREEWVSVHIIDGLEMRCLATAKKELITHMILISLLPFLYPARIRQSLWSIQHSPPRTR